MSGKVWFITGASRGLGRVWAEAALARGDRVAATGIDVECLAKLDAQFGERVLIRMLDVTNAQQVCDVVGAAHAHFGRLDVVLNNAGYSLGGAVEEVKEDEVRAEFDVNFFGPLRVIQAALPLLRAQGGGHIVCTTSSMGIFTLPFMGMYCASKWAVEALHDSLAQEVRPFGIKVTMIEPGPYATSFGSAGSMKLASGLQAYAGLRTKIHNHLAGADCGDPDATADAVLMIVDADEPPLRFALGSSVLRAARAVYADRLATWAAWADVSNAAQGKPMKTIIAPSWD